MKDRLKCLGSALIMPVCGAYIAGATIRDNHTVRKHSTTHISAWRAYIGEPFAAFGMCMLLFVVCTPLCLLSFIPAFSWLTE